MIIGILTQAMKASFLQEMQALEEAIELKRVGKYIENINETSSEPLFTDVIPEDAINKFSKTLMAEIYFSRNGMCGGELSATELLKTQANKIIVENFKVNMANFNGKLFYIDEATSGGKVETYIYDTETGIAFKIDGTFIAGDTFHSLVFYNMVVNGDKSWVEGGLATSVENQKVSSILADGSTVYSSPYEPDLNGFTVSKATMIYYTKSGLTKEMSMQDYITANKPRMINSSGNVVEEGHQTSDTYYLYDYPNQIWANVKSIGQNEKGVPSETWWTWIPRYAYKLGSNGKTEILFIDTAGKYVDSTDGTEKTLSDSDGYTIHEAFLQNGGLEGIWASKYPVSETEYSNKTIAPDFKDFPENTEVLAFTESGKYIKIPIADYNTLFASITEDDYSIRALKVTGTASGVKDTLGTNVTSSSMSISLEGDGEEFYVYNYAKKIWANAVTTNNGKESWWVWIPRYAYYLDQTTGDIEIIFVDTNDEPVDENVSQLPSIYTVHEAFNQNNTKMKGIWTSKYEASYSDSDPYTKITNVASEMNLNDTTEVSASKQSISSAITESSYFKLTYYTEDGRNSTTSGFIETAELGTAGSYSIPEARKYYTTGGRDYYYTRYNAGVYPKVTLYNASKQTIGTYTWYPRYATRTVTENSGTLRIDTIYVTTSDTPVDTSTYENGLNGFTVDATKFGTGISGYWK